MEVSYAGTSQPICNQMARLCLTARAGKPLHLRKRLPIHVNYRIYLAHVSHNLLNREYYWSDFNTEPSPAHKYICIICTDSLAHQLSR